MALDEFNYTPFGNGTPRCFLGTSVPTSGTFVAGDIIYNSAPTADSPALWVCTTGGSTGGTWSTVQAFQNPTAALTTTATSGTLSGAYSMILLNPATTGTYSLPNVTGYTAGSALFIENIASGSTTLTPLAANSYAPAAAITLAQNASITLRAAGGTSTVWYRQQ